MKAKDTLNIIKRTLANRYEDLVLREQDEKAEKGYSSSETDHKKDALLEIFAALADIESREVPGER